VTLLLRGQLVVTASKKILIVEDERLVAQTTALLLSERGYDVKSVRSATEGLSTFEVWQPDLAIVDVFLPDQNGVEMAIALRSEYPGLKILLFSGVPDTRLCSNKPDAEATSLRFWPSPSIQRSFLSM